MEKQNDTMLQRTIPDSPGFCDNLRPHKGEAVKKAFNSIGFLNEFCQKTKNSLPVYITKDREGPDHSPLFNVECQFKSLSFLGSGLTIKEAKESSAFKTIERLNLRETLEKENKPSFRIVEVCPYGEPANDDDTKEEDCLSSIWDEKSSHLKLTIRKKDGSYQEFKTYVFQKI
jgi:hypothetical protein